MKKAAQQQSDQIFCALCREPLDPDTPPGRKVCDGCMGDRIETREFPMATCTQCKRVLPLTSEYFYRARKKKTGFQGNCKKCHDRVNNTARNARMKRGGRATQTADLPSGIVRNIDPQLDPNPAVIYLDLSSYPDLLAYLTDLSRDQERSLEGQIRWILRQCHKYQAAPWSKIESPSAACGEV